MKKPASDHLINRELSWLEFNDRVLYEALDSSVPLLERLRFLAISASNLDEFYMVRVGTLKRLVAQRVRRRCPAGYTPRQQLRAIASRVKDMVDRQYRCLTADLLPALAEHRVACLAPSQLTPAAARSAREYFEEEVFPTLTPVAVEDGEFPRVAGLTLHLAVRLRRREKDKDAAERLALIPLPRAMPRFLPVPQEEGGSYFVLTEDLVSHHADQLFPGHQVLEATAFRLTRNADVPLDDEAAGDLLAAMDDVLRERKSGSPVRLEIDAASSPAVRDALVGGFQINPSEELFEVDGPIDLAGLGKLADAADAEALLYPRYRPQPVPAFAGEEPIFDVMRARDVLVHHPYDSFEPVVRLVEQAAEDPQVIAIKQTLYRTSSDSPIVAALENACSKGKAVTVLVELKARFDEAQNINWAGRLAEAGAQVIYGVMGLKTHAKILKIVRRESDGVRRYVHLSTGNYHDVTARVYEDIGLFTADQDFGADASNLFNAITGYSEPRAWRHFVIAPTDMRARLREMIERETQRASSGAEAFIRLKLNSLLDPEMIGCLYGASQSGVRVEICVRGICALRPGLEGLSENIAVRSVVGRYLEHSRVMHFHNGGDDEFYLSSADWMPRNLDRRVEVLFPVVDSALCARLGEHLDLVFRDDRKAWRLNSDGTYERIEDLDGSGTVSCQEVLMERAQERAEILSRERRAIFEPKGPGSAPGA